MRPGTPPAGVAVATVAGLLACVVGLQIVGDRVAPQASSSNMLYARSPEFIARAALSYDALLADVYWIRALQHYGWTRLTPGGSKEYELLYPLLDITTSLDPRFNIAYRFGSIFLAEFKAEDRIYTIDELDRRVAMYASRAGAAPRTWADLARAGLLTAKPLDPDGFEYRLDPFSGRVTLDAASTLNPLPDLERPGR